MQLGRSCNIYCLFCAQVHPVRLVPRVQPDSRATWDLLVQPVHQGSVGLALQGRLEIQATLVCLARLAPVVLLEILALLEHLVSDSRVSVHYI